MILGYDDLKQYEDIVKRMAPSPLIVVREMPTSRLPPCFMGVILLQLTPSTALPIDGLHGTLEALSRRSTNPYHSPAAIEWKTDQIPSPCYAWH